MQYCKKCKVNVSGNKKCCPLCQGRLSGDAEKGNEKYPNIPLPKVSKYGILRLVTFIAVVVGVISYAVNLLTTPDFMWSVIVILACLCAWSASAIGITYHRRIIKTIMWELILVSFLCVIWDYSTGWFRWSVNFAVPCLCSAAIVATCIITIVMKYPPREYAAYLFAEAIVGIVPFVLLMTGIADVKLPSVICFAVAVLSVASMIFFLGKGAGREVGKKFHM